MRNFMYKLFDHTESNFESIFDEKKLSNNIITEKQKKEKIFFEETKLNILNESLKQTNPESSEFDTLLSEAIDLYININEHVDELEIKQLHSLVKQRILTEQALEKRNNPEEFKEKYIADKWCKRSTLRESIVGLNGEFGNTNQLSSGVEKEKNKKNTAMTIEPHDD